MQVCVVVPSTYKSESKERNKQRTKLEQKIILSAF